MGGRKIMALLVTILAAGLLGCGGTNGIYGVDHQGEGDNDSPAGSGIIEVTVSTSGGSAAIQYTLSISNGNKYTLGANDSLTYHTRRLGTHEVQIDPIPSTCSLTAANPSVVTIRQSETVHVDFVIICGGSQ
ncbi:MAG: hypothetical protein ABI613_08965 [Gemmatimonadota bacterium]